MTGSNRGVKTIPAIALSIRQPWAWAIVNGHKNIENRAWTGPTRKTDREFRGFFAVHAALGMTRHEYKFAMQYMAKLGVTCPPPADLQRGGIVGTATIYDVLWPKGRREVEWAHENVPWFMGPIGLKLTEASPTDFIAAKGALGWFKWKRSADNRPDAPKRWMTPKALPNLSPPETQDLFADTGKMVGSAAE